MQILVETAGRGTWKHSVVAKALLPPVCRYSKEAGSVLDSKLAACSTQRPHSGRLHEAGSTILLMASETDRCVLC